MSAGDVRPNAGLRTGRRAIMAIIAPQQRRWRGSDRHILVARLARAYRRFRMGETNGYLGNVGLTSSADGIVLLAIRQNNSASCQATTAGLRPSMSSGGGSGPSS